MIGSIEEVFQCRRCGACCKGQGGIYLRPDQAEEAGRLLGLSAREFMASCYVVK